MRGTRERIAFALGPREARALPAAVAATFIDRPIDEEDPAVLIVWRIVGAGFGAGGAAKWGLGACRLSNESLSEYLDQ